MRLAGRYDVGSPGGSLGEGGRSRGLCHARMSIRSNVLIALALPPVGSDLRAETARTPLLVVGRGGGRALPVSFERGSSRSAPCDPHSCPLPTRGEGRSRR